MKIDLVVIGNTKDNYLETGLKEYIKRLGHYCRFELVVLQLPKKRQVGDVESLKRMENEMISNFINVYDQVFILDEGGKQMTSVQFSEFLQQKLNTGIKKVAFVIGGAYGINETVKSRSNLVLSMSKMTFSHQMVRLFFVEQLYRAFTILKGEKYHNE